MNFWNTYNGILEFAKSEILKSKEIDFWSQFNDNIDLNIALNENDEWEIFAFPMKENGETDATVWIQIGGYTQREILSSN